MADVKPPYIPIVWLNRFFELIKRVRLEKISGQVISQYNIATPGNTSKVVSALKFLNIIDSNGIIVDSNLNGLKLEGESRIRELKRIVETAYSRLFENLNLNTARKEDIINYFISEFQFSSFQAIGATKFFLYLANESGIKLSPELLDILTTKKGRPLEVKNSKLKIRQEEKRNGKIAENITSFSKSNENEGITIQIRGKGIGLNLNILNIDEIKPNLEIISQILTLNLKKKI
ncbi:MAG: hypothetical protein WC852_01580 [Candidatus Nanoarchaeia archaeon]|jgi:hypothetical protein